MHGETRSRDRSRVYQGRAQNFVPGDISLLREIVVKGTKAGQQRAYSAGRHFSRYEPRFRAERIAPCNAVPIGKHLIDTSSALIIYLKLVANVHVIVAISARQNDSWHP